MQQINDFRAIATDLELIDTVLLKNVAGGTDDDMDLPDHTCIPRNCGGSRGCSVQMGWDGWCGG